MDNNNHPTWLAKALNTPDGNIRVLKNELEERYMPHGVLPKNIFWTEPDERGYITLSVKQIGKMENDLYKQIEKKRILEECVSRNNRGIAFEKAGDIDAAVKLYEENIKPGCYPAMHSFDRLLVIYRRNGDYKNELRVCKRAVTVFKKIDKYKDRLDKTNAKIQKERSKN